MSVSVLEVVHNQIMFWLFSKISSLSNVQAEKRYNVQLALQTLRTIIALGYQVIPKHHCDYNGALFIIQSISYWGFVFYVPMVLTFVLSHRFQWISLQLASGQSVCQMTPSSRCQIVSFVAHLLFVLLLVLLAFFFLRRPGVPFLSFIAIKILCRW